MTFEYPEFLYFLLLVLIPVIIHLFNLRKSKKIIFSNVKFLEQVKAASKSKTKAERLLVLFSRMFFIAFLVFAFAQPKLKTKDITVPNEGRKYLYIDNSLSMQLNKGEGENLELVKNVLLNGLDKSLEYVVLTNNGLSKTAKGKDLEDYISTLTYTNQTKTFNSISNKLSDLPEDARLYIFSDFQKGFFSAADLNDSIKKNIVFVPLENEEVSNIYVDSLWLDAPFSHAEQQVKLTARLKNSGTVDNNSVGVKLSMNNVQKGATLVKIKSGEVIQVSFDVVLSDEGFNDGFLLIEDGSVQFDNEFYFSINTAHRINVALVSDKKEPYISEVYTDTLFDLSTISTQDAQTIDFDIFDLVVLDELASIPNYLIEKLIQSDAAIMVFPSMEVGEEGSYRSFLEAMGVKGIVFNKELSDTLASSAYNIETPDFQNPFFSGFFEKEDANMDMPYAKQVLEWQTGGQVLLSNKSGYPVLNVFKFKQEIYLWSVPLKKSYTNIYTHSLFLPVMYKAAMNSIELDNKLYHTFNENLLAYNGDFSNYRDRLKLFYDKKELANAKIGQVKMLFELPSQNLPSGMFKVGTRDSTFYNVAINYAKDESILEFTNIDELTELFENYPNVEVKPLHSFQEDISADIGNRDNTFPYWKICLILSLMFLLSETLLIRYNK